CVRGDGPLPLRVPPSDVPHRRQRPSRRAGSGGPAAGDLDGAGARVGRRLLRQRRSLRPHATNEEFGPPFYQKLVFVSYFNAGVRALDVRDPYNPRDVAFFIPATTANTDFRCGPYRGNTNVCRQVIQTNNVATDERGFVYIVDRAKTGLPIRRLTGDAGKIVGLDHDDD